MATKEILVVGPNPAHQLTLTFDAFTVDKVNRATSRREYTGGKGTNFCRASRHFQPHPYSSRTCLHTFLGGSTGDRVLELFREEGIEVSPIYVTGETRTCTTCLDVTANTMTELIEPSKPVDAKAADAMDAAIRARLANAAGLAIMGSLPDNTDPDLYTRWARIAAEAHKPLLIDAVKGIEPALCVPGADSLFKVNMEELRRITGKSDVNEAFAYAFEHWTVRILAVTDGPAAAHLQIRGGDGRREFHIAPLAGVVSPLGAGDTADAVFFSLLLHDVDPFVAFRLALAAASANCLHQDSGVFTLEEMLRIADTITIR